METVVSLSDYLERRKRPEQPEKLPEWRRRRMAERGDTSPFIAVKDTSEWRPDPQDAA